MNHATPRKILLAVTGISPQIVTETLYALGCEAKENPRCLHSNGSASDHHANRQNNRR